MDNEKNPSFDSPSQALRWFRKNYFKVAGYALLLFIATGIGRLLKDGNITHSAVLDELAFALATFVFSHIAILFGVFVLGPLMDLVAGE